MGVLLLTDRRFQRNRLLRDLEYLAHLFDGHAHLGGYFLCAGVVAKLLKQLARYADDLVYSLDHVDGEADGSGLVGDGARDRLTDPPRCVGRELVSLGVVKLFDCLYKAEVALLDEVKEQHAAADMALCDRNDQTQVGLGHAALCLLVALAHSYRKLDLLLGGQKRHLADLLEEHANGVVGAVAVIDLDVGHFLLGDLFDLVELLDLRHVDIIKDRGRVVVADVDIYLIGFEGVVKLRDRVGVNALFLERCDLLRGDLTGFFSLFHELVEDILGVFSLCCFLGRLFLGGLGAARALFLRRRFHGVCCQQLVCCTLETLRGHGFNVFIHSFTPHILWFL